MTYPELGRLLQAGGWQRVERDDRLLDILVAETREKGVELWEKWQTDRVHVLRVRLPFDSDELLLYAWPRAQVESWLLANEVRSLQTEKSLAAGESISLLL